MSDCGVCIGSDEYGFDVSLFTAKIVVSRKEHKCEECGIRIPTGARYEYCSGLSDGQFYKAKTCVSCAEIRNAFACGNSYCIGELWSDMEELVFPELTTATKCLQTLSVENRNRVIEKWKKWKGIA